MFKLRRVLPAFLAVSLALGTAGIASAEKADKPVSKPVITAKMVEIAKQQLLQIKNQNAKANSKSGSVKPLAPATPAYAINIIAVDSMAAEGPDGYQDVSNSFSAPYPITGQTYVYSFIYGYDTSRMAWVNTSFISGINAPAGFTAEYTGADLDGDRIIDGFWYIIGFDSNVKMPSGGTFKSQAYSSKGTFSDQLSIRHQ